MGLIAGLVGLVSMAPPSSGVAPAATPPAGPSPTSTSSTAPPTATSTTFLTSTAETSTAPPVRTPAVPGPPVVPAPGSAYLGAFVDPSGQALSGVTPLGGAGGVAAELASLPSVEQGLGRPLSIVEVDQGWGVPVDTAQLGRVAATGAVPMVTWECGDTDADVIAGADDTLITAFARQLRSLGAPVLVRWFPDPNASGPATQRCLGSGGASGYVAAFGHVEQLLVAAGATNAATVWSVDTAQGTGSEWAGFYPGASSADWIAADGYDPPAGPQDPEGVTAAFGSWYSTFSTYGKPLLVSNTGVAPGSQRQFLRQVAADLPTRFPLIKGLVYFDAPREADQTQLALDADGLAALEALSRDSYFQPARSPSTTTITAAVTHVTEGQPVAITGSVDVPDHGGNVTYLSNGSALAGCSDLPASGSVGCDTSALPVGTDAVVAVYSGDTAFEPSDSSPLSVDVESAPATGAGGAPGASVPSAPRVRAGTGPVPCGPPGSAPAAPTGPVHKPAVPGPCQAYLGASVDPNGTTPGPSGSSGPGTSAPSDAAAIAALNQGADRPASIVQLDQTWNAPFNATQLEQVFATGAIPMVTWSCGDSDLKVASGADDLVIAADARALASAGIPLLLRWFPDPGSVPSDTSKCLGRPGAPGYVQAYREIVQQFRLAGAGNVGFVWSVDTNSPQSPVTPWSAYYPGGGFVDWIGADGYDESSSPATTNSIQTQFRAWYSEFASSGKPLMIADTGAIAGPNPSLQATYLKLLGTVLPSAFPSVKAAIYDDASVKAPPTGTLYDFQLNPAGQSAFDSLSAGSYFQPVRSGTTTSVSVSDAAPRTGRWSSSPPRCPVRIWAGRCRSWTTGPPSPGATMSRS